MQLVTSSVADDSETKMVVAEFVDVINSIADTLETDASDLTGNN